MDREVFALLKGLPTFITDIITYLCNGKRERVIDSADFLVHEMHTGSCPRLLVEPEFLPLPHVPRVMACYRFTGKAGRSTPCTESCAVNRWVFVTPVACCEQSLRGRTCVNEFHVTL